MEIPQLESLIKKYATSYYSGESEVSDEYFDSLVDELRERCPNSGLLTTGWGFKPESKKKVPHKYGLHIGSLPKIKSVQSIPSVFGRGTRVSAKLDGLSIVSYYENGVRTQCITRGNGEEGLDVTDKMDLICPEGKTFTTFDPNFTGSIRGEVVMPMTVWNDKIKYQELREENPSANPRNIASGYMNRDELSLDDAKDLRYVVYKILYSKEESLSGSDSKTRLMLMDSAFSDQRLHIVPHIFNQDVSNEDTLKEIFERYKKYYPCDGLVLTNVDENLNYEEIAYKFQAESVEVEVKEVTYNVTRTGRMAPLIWFDPVNLSGAMVRKCTGFNAAFIRDNKIGPGATIRVCRSGEVIPHILGVIKPAESGEYPTVCPNCGTDLVWEGDDLICETENENQLAYHFITTCAPVDGAGWKLYSKIVDGLGLYTEKDLADFLYNLKMYGKGAIIKQLDPTEISGTVTWTKVERILDILSQPINPVRFLVACSIKGISWSTAEAVLSSYDNFFNDVKSSFNKDKLLKVLGVGYKTLYVLDKFRERVANLYSNVELEEYVKEESAEVQFKVAITGSLSVKRADFDAELKKRGIEQSGNFKEIKYLITNKLNSTSSKMKKAQDLGVEIISEEDFVNKYFN